MYDRILALGDLLFGWMLALPNDLIFVCLAVLTLVMLMTARLIVTDQNRLKRCVADKARLKQLLREAKKSKDKAAIARIRATQNTVASIQARSEFKPLLVALLPLVVLATWAMERIEFYPPQPGQEITVSLCQPVSAIGTLTHLVPNEAFTSAEGYIRRFHENKADPTTAIAEWRIQPRQAGQYRLMFRIGSETREHPLWIGDSRYAPTICTYADGQSFSLVQPRSRMLLGLLPGFLGLAPWMLAYLIITVPLFFLSKALLKIA